MKLRERWFVVAAVGAGLSAAPAFGQSTPAPSDPKAKKALDPNEVVCEKQEVLGSRLATKRVCMTRAQWAELRSQDRQEIERAQTRRGMNDR